MEPDILTIAKFATPSLAVIVITIKVLAPLTKALISKMNGIDKSADKRLCAIENDFTHETRGNITELGRRVLAIETDMKKMSDDIATLMERTRKV